MAQQETYGNWLGPERLRRQPGIYSVASKMSPVGDFRPASPDSFDDDYDDVSMAGSEPGPAAKGVYLLAGPPGSSRSPSPNGPEPAGRKSPNRDPNPDRDPKPEPKREPKGFGGCRGGVWGSLCGALVALLVALGALGWGGLLAPPARKHAAMMEELERLRSNLSQIWDLVQQEQTRLQFGIHQHQQELQEISELLCRSVSSPRRCAQGWRSHRDRCYSFSRDSLTWAGARGACADLGAHLAVVNDEDEQLFLQEQSGGSASYWLGLRETEQEGTWRWENGEEATFRFWDVWLEDPQRELKDCGTIGPQGRWVRENCSQFHRWICEKPGNC